jgi:hypothetical protein
VIACEERSAESTGEVMKIAILGAGKTPFFNIHISR